LVLDIQKFHLYADVQALPEVQKETIAEVLAYHLPADVRGKEKLRAELGKHGRSRNLAMWLEDEVREAILDWWKPFGRQHHIPRNALYFVSDYQRSYPFGKLLGQVLHTVQHRRDEATGRALPTGGLEYSLNKYLQGKRGKKRLMRSPRNAFEIGEVIEQPK